MQKFYKNDERVYYNGYPPFRTTGGKHYLGQNFAGEAATVCHEH
jgi:hypothetical protein